jgi:hypothetical protein
VRFATLRFATALVAIGVGAPLGAGAFVFTPSAERWVGFGGGAGVLSVVLVLALTAGRGTVQRVIDALLAPTAAWALVAARTVELHSESTTKWLGLSAGAAITGLGLISLVAHEIAVESDLRWALARLSETPPSQGLATSHGLTISRDVPTSREASTSVAPRQHSLDPEVHALEWHP